MGGLRSQAIDLKYNSITFVGNLEMMSRYLILPYDMLLNMH